MDAGFLAEMPKGVISLDPDGNALDAGFFSRHRIEDLSLIALALSIPQVHAKEHLRPVLRLGSASPRMDGEQGVAAIVPFEKEALQFGLVETLGQGGQGAVELSSDVLPLRGQLGQDFDFFFLFLQPGESGDIALEFFSFLLEELRPLLVLPGLGR